MFCKNCGTQIADGLTSCPNCGTPVEESNNMSQPNLYQQNEYQQPVKQSKGATVFGILSIISLFVFGPVFGFGSIVGLIFGSIGLTKGKREKDGVGVGISIAGIILSIISIIVFIVLVIYFFNKNESVLDK